MAQNEKMNEGILNTSQEIEQQIQSLRNDLKQLEKDPSYSTTINRVNTDGVTEKYSSEEEREKNILAIEQQIRDLENQKRTSLVEEEKKDLQDSIDQNKNKISEIEKGNGFRATIAANDLGMIYDSNDKIRDEIKQSEQKIEELEKKDLNKTEASQESVVEISPEGEKIKNAQTIDELINVLGNIEKVSGSTDDFSGEELVAIVKSVWNEGLPIKYVTRTLGIRDAVERLLEARGGKEGQEGVENSENDPTIPPPLPQEYLDKYNPGAHESLENILQNLEQVRARYIAENQNYISARKNVGLIGKLRQKLMGIKPESKADLPEELIDAKVEYDAAKIKYGKFLMSQQREFLEENQEEDIEEKLAQYKAKEVFDRVVVDEQLLLEKYRAESYPPKEANILMKGLKWYAGQSRLTKLAVGGVFAAGGAMIGGLSAPTVALFAGAGIVRGAISMGAGLVAGKGFEKFVKDNSDKTFKEGVDWARDGFGKGLLSQEFAEKYFRADSETRDREKAKYNLAKNLVIAAVASLTGAGLSQLESHLVNSGAFSAGVKPVPEKMSDITPAPDDTSLPTPTPDTTPIETLPIEPPIDTTITVGGANDNLWSIIKNQLHESNPGFDQLTKAAQTNAVDTIWQKALDLNPDQLRGMGITSGDAHVLLDGQKINVAELLGDANRTEAMNSALNLTAEKLASISHNNVVVERALSGYSGSVREELVNRIIKIAEANK